MRSSTKAWRRASFRRGLRSSAFNQASARRRTSRRFSQPRTASGQRLSRTPALASSSTSTLLPASPEDAIAPTSEGKEPQMQQGVSADIRAPEGFLRGSSIIAEIKASRIEFVLSVPDITTSEGLLRPLSQGSAPRLIRVCKEDEGVGICAGLSYTGRRSLLLIQ